MGGTSGADIASVLCALVSELYQWSKACCLRVVLSSLFVAAPGPSYSSSFTTTSKAATARGSKKTKDRKLSRGTGSTHGTRSNVKSRVCVLGRTQALPLMSPAVKKLFHFDIKGEK